MKRGKEDEPKPGKGNGSPVGGDGSPVAGSSSPFGADGASPNETYVLRLYVTGMTRRSLTAISNIRTICEEHLAGRYELEIVDVYQQPILAKGEQIIAAPTLIKKLPLPLRRFIGDMSQTEKILLGMDLRPKDERPPKAPNETEPED